MVNYSQPVNSLGQAGNIARGNPRERVSSVEENIKVLVADGSEEFRAVLVEQLSAEAGMEVVGETGDGAEALDLLETTAPDVVVMDLDRPFLVIITSPVDGVPLFVGVINDPTA